MKAMCASSPLLHEQLSANHEWYGTEFLETVGVTKASDKW